MVTGSHIPFDRNGYKTNSAAGELRKQDEAPISALVDQVRARLYAEPCAQSLFDSAGFLKGGSEPLPPECEDAREVYLRRYTDFFADHTLRGKRILVYQHSAVGRDLLVELLRRLGAEVVAGGRRETFIPIDTENLEDEQLREIQALASELWLPHGPFDAIVSTDGDSDRPLILSAEPGGTGNAPCQVRFFGGDLVGMVVAEFLRPDAVVVPISCNDAIDCGSLQHLVEPKTRIGSPFVIAGMEKARRKGRQAVCGWEANGGFLTGSDFARSGQVLRALPTRDAVLPILTLLFSMVEQRQTLGGLFDRLPRRSSRAGLLRPFPRQLGRAIIQALTPADPRIQDVTFGPGPLRLLDEGGKSLAPGRDEAKLMAVRAHLQSLFCPTLGFGAIARINWLDGVRIYFDNGDIAHLRLSGNADEMRIYAVADRPERAEAIVRLGVRKPDGLLRQVERWIASQGA